MRNESQASDCELVTDFGGKCIGQDRNFRLGPATLGYTAEVFTVYEPVRPWFRGGPSLPLEFSRTSTSRGGAPLVVDSEHGTETIVSYCVSARARPSEGIEDLRVREGPMRKEWIGSFRSPFEQSLIFPRKNG
jgi:hypothetical protein